MNFLFWETIVTIVEILAIGVLFPKKISSVVRCFGFGLSIALARLDGWGLGIGDWRLATSNSLLITHYCALCTLTCPALLTRPAKPIAALPLDANITHYLLLITHYSLLITRSLKSQKIHQLGNYISR